MSKDESHYSASQKSAILANYILTKNGKLFDKAGANLTLYKNKKSYIMEEKKKMKNHEKKNGRRQR